MAYEQQQAQVIEQSQAGIGEIIARNKVLRQTYALLAANILFSAICSFVGMKMGIGQIPVLVHVVGFVGLSWLVARNATSGLGIVFLFALTGFMGFALSNVMSMFISAGAGETVVKALFGTAVIFAGLSAYVLISGKNFSFLGGFLFCGVIILFLAAIAALFLHMPALNLAISVACLFIFSGYVLYDTSDIIHGEETNYIIATLRLFVDIYNIFVSLLHILAALRD